MGGGGGSLVLAQGDSQSLRKHDVISAGYLAQHAAGLGLQIADVDAAVVGGQPGHLIYVEAHQVGAVLAVGPNGLRGAGDGGCFQVGQDELILSGGDVLACDVSDFL